MRPDLACFKMVNFETVNSRRVRLGIPVKVNIDSGGKPNGIPERR